MNEIDSVSLTKGCFVHKPDKNKKKKSGQHGRPHKVEDESSLWHEIEVKIKQIEERSYAETFSGIVTFVGSCFQSPVQEIEEVPAAVLVMGVNMSDHPSIFSLLEKHFHSSNIFNTVVLESRKCSSVSNMLQVVVFEVLHKYKKFLGFDEDLPKKQECSFAKLADYHDRIFNKPPSSPKKKAHKTKTKNEQSMSKSMVFLIQDVESFSTEILVELVLLCKIYSGKLPIVLIFGMASAMVTLHNILPQKALCCLGVETFHSVSAAEYLTRIIEEVVISPELPFKFGPRVFRLIVDTVLYHDFSVSNLTFLLKFSMLEHLYGKNFISLCCHESEIEERVHQLSSQDLKILKELPSLQVYLDNNPRFAFCMKDSTAFKESIIGFVQNLFHDQRLILVTLKLLYCFIKDLPGYPLGKQLRELYSVSLDKEICLTPAFLEAQKLLKMQSQQGLRSKLESALDFLSECNLKTSFTENIKQMLEESLEKVSKLTTSDFEKNTQDPSLLQSEKIISRFQLQEKIQQRIKQKRSNFEAVRNEIIDNLLQVFNRIRPPSNFPLHELFYFDDISSVKKHLMAVPRVTSCYSLANPHHYLKCACCKVGLTDETSPTMPDTCILYKLHLESGKLINLYDWLEAFKSIKLNSENLVKKSRAKVKPTNKEDELNIRFLLAVSELQMLGFIKPTKRKTDHVARVTFGSF